MAAKRSSAQLSPYRVIVLPGAGASSWLGFPLLNHVVEEIMARIFKKDRPRLSDELIKAVWEEVKANSTLEHVLHRLKEYETSAKHLTRSAFQKSLPSLQLKSSLIEAQSVWAEAIETCYDYLLQFYGLEYAKKCATDHAEGFKAVAGMLTKLARLNRNGRGKAVVHAFTTNYDLGYQMLAEGDYGLSIHSHIAAEGATKSEFHESWYPHPGNLGRRPTATVFLNRLHGSVDWFTPNEDRDRGKLPFGLKHFSEVPDLKTHSMAIKLVSEPRVVDSPAFVTAFHEFREALDKARVLVVWGHSFGDVEVVRAIQSIYSTRRLRGPSFRIVLVDPYLECDKAKDNMRATCKEGMVPYWEDLEWIKVPWDEDLTRVVKNTIDAVKKAMR